MSTLERWIGGSPLAVLLKLIFLSLIVGIVLAALGITPVNIVRRIIDAVRAVIDLGFDAVHDFGRYILTGAVVVIPLWFLARLMNARR